MSIIVFKGYPWQFQTAVFVHCWVKKDERKEFLQPVFIIHFEMRLVLICLFAQKIIKQEQLLQNYYSLFTERTCYKLLVFKK